MAVEIFILSGARRGERFTLDVAQFRAGVDPRSEVYFDPQRDPSAMYREASFRLETDGWYVQQTGGGEIQVNLRTVHGRQRLRSGDVVRMSESGPEFSVAFVARASVVAVDGATVGGYSRSSPPAPKSSPPVALPFQPDRLAAAEPTMPVFPMSPATVSARLPAEVVMEPVVVAASPVEPVARSSETGRTLLLIGGGAAICVACLIAARFVLMPVATLPQGPIVVSAVQAPLADPEAVGTRVGKGSGDDSKPEPKSEKTIASEVSSPPPPPTKSSPDWPQLAEQLKGAVLLIQVEQEAGGASSVWPLATCCAVGEHTLLTSASVACELSQFLREKFKVWVADPASGARQEVQEIRICRDFQTMAGKAVEQQSLDLAFLEIGGKLAKTVALAAAKDRSELEEGQPVACVGFSHQGGKITRHDRFEPELAVGKIFLVKSPPPHASDGPRSLDVMGAMPVNLFGSPLIDARGKLVAVYCKSATVEESHGLKDLHFDEVDSTRLIDAWLRDRDTNAWIPPVSPETTSASQGRR